MKMERMLKNDPRITGAMFGNKKAEYHTSKKSLCMGEGRLPLGAGGVYPVQFQAKNNIRPGIVSGGTKSRGHKHSERY